MGRRPLGGRGLTTGGHADLDGLLAGLGVAVPIRHAVSGVVSGPPSAIQSAALGDAVRGTDLLAVAPTGSGKTLVFAVAVAHRLAGSPSVPGRPRALVVSPTRELAAQSTEVVSEVAAGAGLRVASFLGGQPIARDRRALVAPVDVAVGTPGRLTEMVRSAVLATGDVQLLVLDEADQLLGPSFADQTAALLRACGAATLLLTTATAGADVEDTVRGLRSGLRVHRVCAPAHDTAAAPAVDAGPPMHLVVLTSPDPHTVAVAVAARCRRALFFVPRRDAVEPLRRDIVATGVSAAGVSGSASPTRRAAAFAELSSEAVRILVTTDLAGRGLDLVDVGHIVHVGVPHSTEDLVHRSGRTGRGTAASGIVAAVVAPFEVARVRALAADAGMTVDLVDVSAPDAASRLLAHFGPEILTPRRRPRPAPPARSRRPAQSREHRPKRKRRA